jgi:hypothetical protein
LALSRVADLAGVWYNWAAADFDFRKGGLLSIGMAVLLVAPLLVAKLCGLV